jgi:hypothetical protein
MTDYGSLFTDSPQEQLMDPKPEPTVAGLREILLNAKELEDVAKYFFDLMLTPYVKKGFTIREIPSVIQAVLQELGKRYLKIDGKGEGRVDMHLIRVKEDGFIHGRCTVNNCPGAILYFENDHAGMTTFTFPDGNTEMARFGARPMVPLTKHKPSAN